MTLEQSRNCPICGGNAAGITFPYATQFNNNRFSYLKCGGCSSVFVDPLPDSQTFVRMYAKSDYHDCHYKDIEEREYAVSAQLLRQYLSAGTSVLDYGCGVGAFLKALSTEGFVPNGVEFDRNAAYFAGQRVGCVVMSVDDFWAQIDKQKFDAIHLGDVLEHLPDPAGTLIELLAHLKPGGILFVEGPLEINPSPVYWGARFFGTIKHMMRPIFVANDAPTHLFRTSNKQQKAFFYRVEPSLDLLYWQIYETGWPYTNGGLIKRAISRLARNLGGMRFLGSTFGNRFRGVFVYQKSMDGTGQSNAGE